MPKEESTFTIDKYGDKYWRNKEGKLHRIHGPAIECSDGTKRWYKMGKLHRIDGPAVEFENGDKFWYQMGRQHRIDSPAVEFNNGVKHWYQNGVLHRIDGPAVEYPNGDKFWFYNNGKFHTKEAFFDALTDEEKSIALFSEVFLNA